jgi:hypothetical protein
MKRLFTFFCALTIVLASMSPVSRAGTGSEQQTSSGILPVQYTFPANGGNVDALKIAAYSGHVIVSWSLEGVGPQVEGFRVYVGETNPPQTLVFNDFNSQAPIPNMEYNKTYYWKVVPFGFNGEAQNVPVWSFTTYDRVPFFHEDFKASASIPEGWQSQDVSGSGIHWFFDGSEASIGATALKGEKGNVYTTLTTQPINCIGKEDVHLYLDHNIWTAMVDNNRFMGIEVSNDGENWVDVVRFHEPLHPLWTHFFYYFDYDVSAVADNQEQVWIRLVFQGDTNVGMQWRLRQLGLKFFAEHLAAPAVKSPADGATDQPIHLDLGWYKQLGATPLGYRVYLDKNNPPQTLIVNHNVQYNTIDSVIHLLRDLEYNTTYYWKVVPYNTSVALTEVPVWSFTTAEEFVISEVPFFENFDGVNEPYFPLSWTRHQRFIDTFTDLRTVTQHTNNANIPPHSTPNHVRFGKVSDPTAQLVLVSPQIDMDIQELRIRFMGMATTIGPHPTTPPVAIEVGTMTNPKNPNTFSHVRTVQIGPAGGLPYVMDYREFGVSFEYQPVSGQYIAFRAATTQSHSTRIYIDDFTLETAPTDPLLKSEPESFDFGIVEQGLPESIEFTIFNYGGGMLTIAPEEIYIEGPGADAYQLNSITSSVSLKAFESITLSVLFDTEDLELKEASLVVAGTQIPLSGEFVRPEISTLPYAEFFDKVESPRIPFGWRKIILSEAYDSEIVVQPWAVSMYAEPVSFPNALNMRNRGDGNAKMLFISPPVELEEPVENIRVRFHAYTPLEHNYLEVGIMTDRDDPETYVPAGRVWLWPEGAMWWEYAIDVRVPDVSSFYIALRPDFFRRGRGISIDNLFIESTPQVFPVDFQVKENSPEGQAMEGVSLRVIGHYPLTEKHVISDSQGAASLMLGAGTHTVFVKQPGYTEQAIEFEVTGLIQHQVEVPLTHIIHPPFNPVVTTSEQEPGNALFQWNSGASQDFRYDSGNMMIHIGFGNGEVWPLELMPLGTAFKYHAEISQVSWFTSNADVDSHETVALWVLGLDENGFPDRNQLLYHNPQAPNTDNQWTTYKFPEPIRTPNGFFVGLAYDGFLGIGIDNGITHPYQFRELTHFTVISMHDPNFVDVLPLEAWGLPFNPMIRAFGYKISDLQFKPLTHDADLMTKTAELPELKMAEGTRLMNTSEPEFDRSNIGSVAAAYHVFLNEMTQPFAYWLYDKEYLFADLEPGTYSAGVQTAFSTGVSEIVNVSFTIDNHTGIEIPVHDGLKVFPNPARNFINVVAESIIREVKIFNMAGQMIYSDVVDGESHQINLGGLNQGIYLMQINTVNEFVTRKIQIVK